MSGIKRGKDLSACWDELLETPPAKPRGYSTTVEIAQKTGRKYSTVKEKLRQLRRDGKIEGKQVYHEGKWVWCYKDGGV